MRSRLAVGIATLLAFGGASIVALAASVDDAAIVAQPARRVDIPNNPDLTVDERPGHDMMAIINLLRLEQGLPIVFWNDQVAAAARGHSADMVGHGTLDHLGSDGSTTGVRLSRAGFAWRSWGENIGSGFDDPQVLVDAWMESPAHRRHLLGDFTYLGVGVVATPDGVAYWTLDLAG